MPIGEQIRNYILEGKHVALWGASNDAIMLVNELRNQYNVCPELFIDSDVNKQGKCFMDIPIVSATQALEMFPDICIYIVASNYKYQVMGSLLHDMHVAQERIINYEPVVWKKGCMFIENALQCVGNSVCFCSSDFGKKKSPRVQFKDSYESTITEWNQLRNRVSKALEDDEECSCSGCCCVKEDWYAESPKIHIVNYSEGGVCNFGCIYCNAAAKTSKGIDDSEIDLAQTVSVLEHRQMLADDLHIDYSPGEPALHKKRESYYDAFRGKHTALIMTNASIYDEGIESCLAAGKASLCVSVDAGTKETFHKVKGRDMYEKVCDNLCRYAKTAGGVVGLKYIFLPNENDTVENVKGFIALCKEIKPAIVLLSYDIFHPVQTLTRHTYEMVLQMIAELDDEGIVWKNVSDVIGRAFGGDIL